MPVSRASSSPHSPLPLSDPTLSRNFDSLLSARRSQIPSLQTSRTFRELRTHSAPFERSKTECRRLRGSLGSWRPERPLEFCLNEHTPRVPTQTREDGPGRLLPLTPTDFSGPSVLLPRSLPNLSSSLRPRHRASGQVGNRTPVPKPSCSPPHCGLVMTTHISKCALSELCPFTTVGATNVALIAHDTVWHVVGVQ